jgi:hypothetical protein
MKETPFLGVTPDDDGADATNPDKRGTLPLPAGSPVAKQSSTFSKKRRFSLSALTCPVATCLRVAKIPCVSRGGDIIIKRFLFGKTFQTKKISN